MEIVKQRMANPARTILGILSVVPIISIIWLLVYIFTRLVPYFIELENSGMDPSPGEIFSMLSGLIVTVVIMGFLHFGLLVFFIIHLMQDHAAKDGDRLVWLLLLLFFNPFSYTFYWYFRIYNDRHMSTR